MLFLFLNIAFFMICYIKYDIYVTLIIIPEILACHKLYPFLRISNYIVIHIDKTVISVYNHYIQFDLKELLCPFRYCVAIRNELFCFTVDIALMFAET